MPCPITADKGCPEPIKVIVKQDKKTTVFAEGKPVVVVGDQCGCQKTTFKQSSLPCEVFINGKEVKVKDMSSAGFTAEVGAASIFAGEGQ